MFPVSVPVGDFEKHLRRNESIVSTHFYPLKDSPYNELRVDFGASLDDDFDASTESFQHFNREQALTISITVEQPKCPHHSWYLGHLYVDWPFERAPALAFGRGTSVGGGVSSSAYEQGYDPELRRLFYTGRPGGSSEARIAIFEPSRVADVSTLEGKACMVFEDSRHGESPSGLSCKMFDATGAPVRSDVTYAGAIVIDFTIDLEGIFRKRSFWVERRFTFDGVIPEPGRFADIVGAMQDAGIGVPPAGRNWASSGGAEGKKGDLPDAGVLRSLEVGEQIEVTLEGQKQIGGSACDSIRARVRGEKMEATRQLALAGGGFTQATIRSGKIEMDLWAKHENYKELNRLFDDVEKTLRERLARFRII